MLQPSTRVRLGRALTALATAVFTLYGVAAAELDETIYATNTHGDLTEFCRLEIDESSGIANLVHLRDFDDSEVFLGEVDAMGCSPDGREVYLLDKYHPAGHPLGGMMAVYDLESDQVTEIGMVVDSEGRLVEGIVLAAFLPGPERTLYVASERTDCLYTVDLGTAIATLVGPVYVSGTESAVDLEGADMAFTSDGRLFLWTNSANLPDADFGLYELTLPAGGSGDIDAVYLGRGSDGSDPNSYDEHFFTGLAARYNGLGTLVGCNRSEELHEHDRVGDDVAVYAMELDGAPMDHWSGDLCNAEFNCFIECTVDPEIVPRKERFTIDVRVIHNRPQTVTTPLYLTIENPKGEIVLERQSASAVTLAWGDELVRSLEFTAPRCEPAGVYTVYFQVKKMHQGLATAECQFEIVGHGECE